MKIQVLKDGPVVEVTDNSFCPTGKGGGVDPSCGSESDVGGQSSAVSGFSNKQIEGLLTSAFHGKTKMQAAVRKEIKGKSYLEKFQLAKHIEERGHSLAGGDVKERSASRSYAKLSKYIISKLNSS